MVDAELRFEPVSSHLPGRHHDAGVVHEHVEPGLLIHLSSCVAHTGKVGLVNLDDVEVGVGDIDTNGIDCCVGLVE